MNFQEFLDKAVELGCTLEKSFHEGIFRVVINDQEKFIAGGMRKDVAYQFFLPGNSLPTKGSLMNYTEAIQKIKDSKSAA